MKNNQIVFSATIHVILIHQTNFLSSCLTIHNSSTHPNRNSTPVVLCPVASYCCPSVPHCQRKLFCCQLPVTMWGAPAKHCGPISFALCISSSDLVNRQSSWPPAPAPTICLSVSLSLFHTLSILASSIISRKSQQTDFAASWAPQSNMSIPYPAPSPYLPLTSFPSSSTPFHSFPSRVHFAHIKLLCAYQNRANFNYLFIQMVMG